MDMSILFPSNPSRGGSESIQMFLGQNGQRRPFTIIMRGWAQPSGTGAQRSGGQTGSTSGPIRRNSCRTKFGGKNIAGIWPKIKKIYPNYENIYKYFGMQNMTRFSFLICRIE